MSEDNCKCRYDLHSATHSTERAYDTRHSTQQRIEVPAELDQNQAHIFFFKSDMREKRKAKLLVYIGIHLNDFIWYFGSQDIGHRTQDTGEYLVWAHVLV